MEASAEDTREKLVAALAAQKAAEEEAAEQSSARETREVLLNVAREELAQSREQVTASQKQAELLNQQVAQLRQQLGQLQALLDDANARDAEAQVQLQNLGSNLNAALARVASEERKLRQSEEEKRKLEEAERRRLEAEKEQLEQYRSDFFGRLRQVLGDTDGVSIVGDRFVFSSEVLFDIGSADLSPAGEAEIAKVAAILRNISSDIPEGIDWIIRVDGHTDDSPISGGSFADNWELSQARALSVVRFMTSQQGIAPQRLSANGFGEYQPVNPADTAEARAQNRRIELKLTER